MFRSGEKYHNEIKMGKIAPKHGDHIRQQLREHGAEVTRDLKKITSRGARSGRLYTYKGEKIKASAPGEPPQSRSGKLSKSFIYKSRPTELLVANKAFSKKGFPYPGFLEEDGNRPFFLITIEGLHQNLRSRLQKWRPKL